MIKSYFIALVLYVGLDYVWMRYIAGDLYFKWIGPISRALKGRFDVFLPSAAAVYLVMSFAMVYFVLNRVDSRGEAALVGALLGFCLYAVFDFTNHAILRDYPLPFVVVDILWGTVLNATVAAVAYRSQFDI